MRPPESIFNKVSIPLLTCSHDGEIGWFNAASEILFCGVGHVHLGHLFRIDSWCAFKSSLPTAGGSGQFELEVRASGETASVSICALDDCDVMAPSYLVEILATSLPIPARNVPYAELAERKLSELALKKSEQRLLMAQDASHTAFFEFDPGTGQFIISEVGARLVDFDRTTLTAEDILSLVPVGEPDNLSTIFAEAVLGKSEFELEHRFVHARDGDVRWMNIRGEMRRDPDSQLWLMLGTIQDVTRRKRAEIELSTSRALLAEAEQLSRSFSWEWDLVTNDWKASPNALHFLGSDLATPSASGLSAILHPGDHEYVHKLVRAGVAKKERFTFEHRLRLPGSKDIRIMQLIAQPYLDDAGEVIKVLGTSRDITEKRRAQQALLDSELKFRAFMKHVPAVVYIKDEHHRYEFANDAIVSLGKRSVFDIDAFEGSRTNEIFPADIAAELDRREEELVRTGESMQEELAVKLKNGEVAWLQGIKFPIDQGERKLIGAFYVDISERKRAAIENERLLMAIEQSGEIIMITDAQGQITYVNPVFEAKTGYSRGEVTGLFPWDLEDYTGSEVRLESIMESLLAGIPWQGILRQRRKDGTAFNVDSTISAVLDETGQVVSYVGVKRDITRQQELERSVAQAQKMESIGTLAGGVAHDYNNVLQTVLGNTELLIESCTSPDSRELLHEIKSAAEQSAGLTNQLLAFARKQTIAPVVTSLNDEVEKCRRMLQRLIGSNIVIHWHPASSLWNVNMDPAQVNQVLTNLCINARDAIRDVGNIFIRTRNIPDGDSELAGLDGTLEGEFVCLEVVDDGCGMSEAVAGRVFEPFFTTKGITEGTGLGLATVYGIVHQNNGQVAVESREGEGATFRIYLPRNEEALASGPVEKAPPLLASSNQTILLVEDEPAVLKLVARTLERQGYRVLTADGPECAIAQARDCDSAIDLVVSDIVMPTMNGKDVVAQVKQYHPDIRVLFMSGYSDDILDDENALVGNRAFIQKPFGMNDLCHEVTRLLELD